MEKTETAESGRAEERIEQVAHYIIAHRDAIRPRWLCRVMWWADLMAYRRYGESLTGLDVYVKVGWGPTPRGLRPALGRLRNRGDIHMNQASSPVGLATYMHALKHSQAAWFSAEEAEVLHECMAYYDAVQRGEADAEEDAGNCWWADCGEGEDLPIKAGSVMQGNVWPEDMDWAREWAQGEVEAMERGTAAAEA